VYMQTPRRIIGKTDIILKSSTWAGQQE
jgi:hypothetical protein